MGSEGFGAGLTGSFSESDSEEAESDDELDDELDELDEPELDDDELSEELEDSELLVSTTFLVRFLLVCSSSGESDELAESEELLLESFFFLIIRSAGDFACFPGDSFGSAEVASEALTKFIWYRLAKSALPEVETLGNKSGSISF